MRISKKILAIALSILMAVSMMPFTVFAEDVPEGTTYSFTDTNGVTTYKTTAFPASFSSNGTYKLYQDVSTTNRITLTVFTYNVTIDLNGHNITSTANDSSYPGTINMSRAGTASKHRSISVINTSSTPSTITNTVGDGVVIDGNYNDFTLGENVTMTVKGIGVWVDDHTNDTVTINGDLVSTDYWGLYVNGTNAGPNTLTVNGSVTGDTAGIYAAGVADYIVNGTVTGDTGIYQKGGNLVVNNGAVVTATGDKAAYVQNGNGMSATGDAIVVEDNASYNLGTTEIKGGTITSTAEGTQTIAEYDADNVSTDPAESRQDIEVITGTFVSNGASDDVSEYIKDANATQNATTGTVTTTSVARIGDTFYNNIEDAMADVPTDNTPVTIQFIKDCSISGRGCPPIKSGQNVTFDLDGHDWNLRKPYGSSGTATNGMQILEGATVTIKNGRMYAKLATIYKVIQNYGNLTIENATIEYTSGGVNKTALSTNSSNVVVKNSTIAVKSDGSASEPNYAIQVNPGWGGYTDASLVLEDTTITGNAFVEATAAGSEADVEFTGTTSFTRGGIVMSEASNGTTVVENTGTGVDAPEGYEWVGDGATQTLALDNHTVAKIGNAKYDTLAAAFAAAQDGDTITLVQDCTGDGIAVPKDTFATEGLTVDFAGYTYTCNGNYAGSTGTQRQVFQLNEGNKITFKDGTITSAGARMLIQNYSDLTLDNMTLNQTGHTDFADKTPYALSNNNGTVVINDTTINACNDGFAFDACRYASYTAVSVTVTGDSEINGNIEMSASANNAKDGLAINLLGGELNGNIVLDASAQAAMEATPAKAGVTKADTFTQAAPAGYKWVSNGDGTSSLVEKTPEEAANGSSLALTDKIETTIYIDAAAYNVDASEAVVKATYNHNTADTAPSVSTDTYALSELTQYSGQTEKYVGTYMFTYACAPAQLTEDCTVELYANAEAAEPVYSQTYSAKSYCDKVNAAWDDSDKTDASLQKLDALCDSLVDYAKAAQFQFNYSKDLTDPYRNEAVQTLTAGDITATANVKTSDVAGFAFDCQDELNILVYTNSAVAPTGVSMNATKYADKINAAADSKDSTKFIRVKGLGSGNINKVVTVNTANGDITVSANAIVKAYLGADVSSNMKDLARAIYLYGAAAADYFGA